jgi:hypothetical protein
LCCLRSLHLVSFPGLAGIPRNFRCPSAGSEWLSTTPSVLITTTSRNRVLGSSTHSEVVKTGQPEPGHVSVSFNLPPPLRIISRTVDVQRQRVVGSSELRCEGVPTRYGASSGVRNVQNVVDDSWIHAPALYVIFPSCSVWNYKIPTRAADFVDSPNASSRSVMS